MSCFISSSSFGHSKRKCISSSTVNLQFRNSLICWDIKISTMFFIFNLVKAIFAISLFSWGKRFIVRCCRGKRFIVRCCWGKRFIVRCCWGKRFIVRCCWGKDLLYDVAGVKGLLYDVAGVKGLFYLPVSIAKEWALSLILDKNMIK